MIFVKTRDLKRGMRLAKPIYNKDGVLLYERNSKLTQQGIVSVNNFGLIGIFVLEPAEPVPPMTRDDIKFERFQTMTVFSIQEELTKMIQIKRSIKIQVIAANIIKNYGNLSKKVNFVQNLRSQDDYIYKHALNAAILCAMVAHSLNIKLNEQLDAVVSAVVHDIGKAMMMTASVEADKLEAYSYVKGMELIDHAFVANPGVKRTCMQAHKIIVDFKKGKSADIKAISSAKILAVAETYDTMTAMRIDGEPASEVEAIRTLINNPKVFEPAVVEALINSINILNPGTCIELNTGEKGVVLAGNKSDILRPTILTFRDNEIIDLSNKAFYGDLLIADIMKTMDNRYIMDIDILKKQGVQFEAPQYVEVPEEEEEYVPGQ